MGKGGEQAPNGRRVVRGIQRKRMEGRDFLAPSLSSTPPPKRQLLLRHPVGGEGLANLEVADDVMDTGAVLGEPLGEHVGGGGLRNDPMKTLLTTKYPKCPLGHKNNRGCVFGLQQLAKSNSPDCGSFGSRKQIQTGL